MSNREYIIEHTETNRRAYLVEAGNEAEALEYFWAAYHCDPAHLTNGLTDYRMSEYGEGDSTGPQNVTVTEHPGHRPFRSVTDEEAGEFAAWLRAGRRTP